MLDDTFTRKHVVEKTKTFPPSAWHAAKDGQKCSRWNCGKPATKSRTVGGAELGACAGHAAEMVEKRTKVDGDGDGFVDDNKPSKRPATPAERAAGARQRAARGAGAVKRPVAAKKPAAGKPKGEYEKRIDKFDRAINQAVKSGDKKQIKRVNDLIGQDFILKKPDRDRLQQVLADRAAGKPAQAAAPAPKKAAPPAKKAAAPKPPEKKAPSLTEQRAERAAAGERAAARRQAVRDAAAAKPKTDSGPGPATAQERKESDARRQAGGPVDGAETKAYEAIQAAKNVTDLGEVVVAVRRAKREGKINGERYNKVLAEVQRKRQEIAPRKASMPKTLDPPKKASIVQRLRFAVRGGNTTGHGPGTRYWQKAAAKDIGEATGYPKLKGILTQIDNKQRDGRISDREAKALRSRVIARLTELGLDMNGKPVSARFRQPAVPASAQDKAAALDDVKDIERKIAGAKNEQELLGVRANINAAQKVRVQRYPDYLNRVNEAYKNKKRALQQQTPETPVPPKDSRDAKVKEVEALIGDAANMRGRVAREAKVARALAAINDSDLGQSTQMDLINRAEAVYNGRADPGPKAPARKPPRPSKTPPKAKTVQPPSQPGKARADAAAAGGPRANPAVRSYLKQIDAAENTGGLQAIANDLGNGKGGLNAAEVDEVFDALDRKHRRLEPLADNRKARILGRPPRPKNIPVYQGNVKDSPAGKEMEAGANIEDVKDPEGLYDYIVANSKTGERFQIKKINNGQVSSCATVIDTRNGKRYFFKATDNNGPAEMWGDGVNEYMAAALGNAAFPGNYPDVQWAGRPEGNRNARIRMEHMDEIAKRVGGAGAAEYNGAGVRGKDLKDPKQALQVHIFDYLINQTDRHSSNFGHVKTPGGIVLVPLDNGAAFHGYDGYMNAYGNDRRKLAETPEAVSYNEWAAKGKTGAMRDLAKSAYDAKGWGSAKMQKDADEILEQFRNVDIDTIMAQLRERFPKINDYEDDHLEGAALIWKTRMEMLDTSDVVRMLR